MRQSCKSEEIVIIISTPNFPSQSLLISKDSFAFQKLFLKSGTYERLGWLMAQISLYVTSNIEPRITHNFVSAAGRRRGFTVHGCGQMHTVVASQNTQSICKDHFGHFLNSIFNSGLVFLFLPKTKHSSQTHNSTGWHISSSQLQWPLLIQLKVRWWWRSPVQTFLHPGPALLILLKTKLKHCTQCWDVWPQ